MKTGQIEIYAWGDPEDRSRKVRALWAGLISTALVSCALGYLWCWAQGVAE